MTTVPSSPAREQREPGVALQWRQALIEQQGLWYEDARGRRDGLRHDGSSVRVGAVAEGVVMSPKCWHCDSQQSELRFAQFSGLRQVGMSLRYTARSARCSWSRPHTTPMDASGESRRGLLRSLRVNSQVLAVKIKAIMIHGAPPEVGRRPRVQGWVHAGPGIPRKSMWINTLDGKSSFCIGK